VIVCEAQALLASHALIVADPLTTVAVTDSDFEKLPLDVDMVVTVCWVEPPCTTEIVIVWLAPK
jgi:hypothetical protein